MPNPGWETIKLACGWAKDNLPTFIALAKEIKEICDELKTPELLTYADVIGYVTENSFLHMNARKAACLLEADTPVKIAVVVMFLDQDNRLIEGVRMNAKAMNEELRETFGQNQLFLIE